MRYLTIILAVLLLASCSVKKRSYRDGYYIDWAFQKKKCGPEKRAHEISTQQAPEQIPSQVILAKVSGSEELLATPNKNALLLDTCGDVITFKSGDQVRGKVIEITDDKIKYKRCDNLAGPLFVVNKSNVALIRYVNGFEEKIEAPATPVYTQPKTTQDQPTNSYPPTKKPIHPYAWWALATLVLFCWIGIGFISGLILSLMAIKRIKAEPNKWAGLRLANTIKIICMVFFGLILLGLLANL